MKTGWNVLKALVLILALNACDIGDDEVNYHFVTLQVVAVDMPESFQVNETYQIGVTVLEPNGCTQFEGFNILSEDTTVRQVAAIGTQQLDAACTQVVTEVETSFEFICLYGEPYLFRFWTGESASGEPQYLEIEVPVTP
jgi:hypothetical protein